MRRPNRKLFQHSATQKLVILIKPDQVSKVAPNKYFSFVCFAPPECCGKFLPIQRKCPQAIQGYRDSSPKSFLMIGASFSCRRKHRLADYKSSLARLQRCRKSVNVLFFLLFLQHHSCLTPQTEIFWSFTWLWVDLRLFLCAHFKLLQSQITSGGWKCGVIVLLLLCVIVRTSLSRG